MYYYDTTALGANYAVNDQDFHWVVCHEFERHGWQVEDVYLGNPMRHDEKYLLINQGFAGKQRLMPFFNRQNNDDLILAIQSAGVTRGRNGFRKDKGGEKLAETEEDLLQHRTDGTDAFDTLYIGCEKFPHREICRTLQVECYNCILSTLLYIFLISVSIVSKSPTAPCFKNCIFLSNAVSTQIKTFMNSLLS